jgi:hypothetical protein
MTAKEFRDKYFPLPDTPEYKPKYRLEDKDQWNDLFISEFHRIQCTSEQHYNNNRTKETPVWQTIAQLNAGETATLKCGPTEDTKYVMASDVVVKVNKVEGGSSGGVEFTSIKEIDNIIIIPSEEEPYTALDQIYMLESLGYKADYGFHIIPTRTTSGIVPSGMVDGVYYMHFYFIEDENEVLAYGDFDGSGSASWGKAFGEAIFKGMINSMNEVDSSLKDVYYVLVSEIETINVESNGEVKQFIKPSKELTIAGNGTYDCTFAKTVIVEANPCVIKGEFIFKDTIGSIAYSPGDVLFTAKFDFSYTNLDGEEISGVVTMIDYGLRNTTGSLWYYLNEEWVQVYDGYEKKWIVPEAQSVNFGDGVEFTPNIYSWLTYYQKNA